MGILMRNGISYTSPVPTLETMDGVLPVANGGTGAMSLSNITVGRATSDASGNNIVNTYASKANDLANTTISIGADGKPYINWTYNNTSYSKKLGSSDGTATAAQVLSGATFNSANYDDLTTGTMINRGTVTQTLNTSTTSYTIPQGYHSGSGKVSITTQTKTATPSASSQTISPDSGKVLSSVTVNAISLKTQTVSQTITLNANGNTTKTFTFSNLTTIYGITKIQKTSGSELITMFSGYPDPGTGNDALNIPSGGISGNKITQRFINNSDANNQSAVIAITAIGV